MTLPPAGVAGYITDPPVINAATLANATPRQRRKDARPQELLAAAVDLFVEKGFAATRSEEVAARAGVAKGTLYRYYPSKEELFKAVVHENLGVHIAESAALAAQYQGSIAELLAQMMQAWWAKVGEGNAGGISKIMLVEARNFPELAQFYVDEVIAPSKALLGGLVERGIRAGEFREVPIEATVHMLIAPMLHLMLHEHSFGEYDVCAPSMGAAQMLEAQMSLLLHGLLARPG
ncbi:TetR/AcrR family transcriptional regulator [Roseateles saccharophilus]|uniref:TetR family transcriptional regulator n=1 Tax=Roseateles saccharophilus TaxID=304 RepID=A0A4R3VI01_ROSSA|nr:TetR/AcrR family transcriptional regulator [Roseateles saccharophilus]TCV03404.1 TetR family transcriptional regulator [Roseateles saccharophilus]